MVFGLLSFYDRYQNGLEFSGFVSNGYKLDLRKDPHFFDQFEPISVSSSSCSDPSILLIRSASDFVYCDSRYCAPTDVPHRSICFTDDLCLISI
jgi:hypothetical protein